MAIIENIKKQLGQLKIEEYPPNLTPSTSILSPLSLKSFTPTDQQSFEETHKLAYSHGLESIYKLENVDLKSIRPIVSSFPEKKEKSYHYQPPTYVANDQMELDLGDQFRGWMDSFVKMEPIHVLGLARHAEKCLLDHGKTILADLIGVDLKEWVFLKGMGQGHIEEVRQKLHHYLEGRLLTYCTRVDFASWIRSLAASFERKKTYVAMEPYHLSDFFTLSPGESVEVKRLTLEKKQEWVQEIIDELTTQKTKECVLANMRKVVDVFFKPWVQNRLGLATRSELLERMNRISEIPEVAVNVLSFFGEIYYKNDFPIGEYLYLVDKDLFCSDLSTVQTFERVILKARSYFYRRDVIYPLDDLVSLLEREFAASWQGFRNGFIEKVLRLSHQFHVKKAISGYLEISLA